MRLQEQPQSKCRYMLSALVASGTVFMPVTPAYADPVEDMIQTVSSSTALTFGAGVAVGAVVAGLLGFLLHQRAKRRYIKQLKSSQHGEQQATDELWYVKERLELLQNTVVKQEHELEGYRAQASESKAVVDDNSAPIDVEEPSQVTDVASSVDVQPVTIDDTGVFDVTDLDEVFVEPVETDDLDEAVIEPIDTVDLDEVVVESDEADAPEEPVIETAEVDDLDEVIAEPVEPVQPAVTNTGSTPVYKSAKAAAHMAADDDDSDDMITIERGAVIDYPYGLGGTGEAGLNAVLSEEDMHPTYDIDDIADVMNDVEEEIPPYRNVRVVLEERLTPDVFNEVGAARRVGMRSDIPAFLGQRRARQYDPIVRASLIDQRVPRFDESLFPDTVTHVHEELDVFETAMRAMEDTLQHTAVLGIEDEEDILYLSPEERPEIVDAAAYVDYLVQDELEKTLSGETLSTTQSHLSLFEGTGDLNISKNLGKRTPRHMRVVSKEA